MNTKSSSQLRALCILPATLLLAGCFQTQLNGTVAAATVTLTTLRQPLRTLYTITGSDKSQIIEHYGQDKWDKSNTVEKLTLTGVITLPEKELAKKYYLLTASGGSNRDPGALLQYLEDPRPVNGSWHAILPPHRVGHKNNRISLLTEASYQWVMGETHGQLPTDKKIGQLLDQVSRHLVGDVDRNGSVNYDDLLSWDIYWHKNLYLGDPVLLEQLDLVLSLNSVDDIVRKFALRLIPVQPGPLGPLTGNNQELLAE